MTRHLTKSGDVRQNDLCDFHLWLPGSFSSVSWETTNQRTFKAEPVIQRARYSLQHRSAVFEKTADAACYCFKVTWQWGEFLGFLQKLVPYSILTLPFEPFRFWLEFAEIFIIEKLKRLPDSASRRLNVLKKNSASRRDGDSPNRQVGELLFKYFKIYQFSIRFRFSIPNISKYSKLKLERLET